MTQNTARFLCDS